jgi:N-acylglucosamine-6-phosphate 2-epimerase
VEQGPRRRPKGTNGRTATLSGYTRESEGAGKLDLALVGRLAGAGVRVVCEGHIKTPEHVSRAYGRGALAVVVGTAITDPLEIATWFTRQSRKKSTAPGK